MTDDGHAADLAPFYLLSAGLRYLSSPMARIYRAQFGEQGYARFVAETAHYAAVAAVSTLGLYCVWGFMPDGGVESMADGRGSLWLQSHT